MAFIGMESLNTASLLSVQKKQNKVEEYKTILINCIREAF